MTNQQKLCVGIDLGTTNSVLAIINTRPNGNIVSKVVDIPRASDIGSMVGNRQALTSTRRPLLPSCVYYRAEDGYRPMVGDFARRQYGLRPHLVAKSVKSHMGEAAVPGMAQEVPDKSPAQISARILQHLLKEAGKILRQPITEAVITVPANFDAIMCQATLEAAQLAGINTKNADGTPKLLLLSEPNAVIYDLINQINNGELSPSILSLDTPKQVLVFDLGGGTLDVTYHILKARENSQGVKVEEIATNRYTLLGGDDFDTLLANAMYSRYLDQYSSYPEVLSRITKETDSIKAQLLDYAESLKLELSDRYPYGQEAQLVDSWGYEEEEDTFDVGGNMHNGYAYTDSFTKEEAEEALASLMGQGLTFADYQKLDQLTDHHNIIFPILDVLAKAAAKLKTAPQVDAVIVNGGMSKFYLVLERLKEFFNLEPIVALDPDQAVARGAAVYHYYLQQYSQLQEDMVQVTAKEEIAAVEAPTSIASSSSAIPAASAPKPKDRPLIEFGKTILNDGLYLGMRSGAVQEIIPTGTELPYISPYLEGYAIEPKQTQVLLPIKRRSAHGYVTIASAGIKLKQGLSLGGTVGIQLSMSSNKLIQVAMTVKDNKTQLSSTYAANLLLGAQDTAKADKISSTQGSILSPKNELNRLRQICCNLGKKGFNSKETANKIAMLTSIIKGAANKSDFAQPILKELGQFNHPQYALKLLSIANIMARFWQGQEQERLLTYCLNLLRGLGTLGYINSGAWTNVYNQAIYILANYGHKDQLVVLEPLRSQRQYYIACLYAYGKQQENRPWICQELTKALEQNNHGGVQFTAHAFGMLVKDRCNNEELGLNKEQLTDQLCAYIDGNRDLEPRYADGLVHCLIALGYLGDNRYGDTDLAQKAQERIQEALNNLPAGHNEELLKKVNKALTITQKMLAGTALKYEEEEYLLTLLAV